MRYRIALLALVVVLPAGITLPAGGGTASTNGRIAYERRGLGSRSEVWTMNQDGSQLRRVAVGSEPAWSPDGNWIALVGPDKKLNVMRADGSAAHVVEIPGLDPPGFDWGVGHPAWSPDGTQIAFNSLGGLYVAAAGGGQARALAPGYEPAPAWSPDGTRIAFIENGAVEVIDADGSNRLALPGARSGNGQRVAWSPDGSAIAFGDSSTGGISIVRFDGRAPTPVVPWDGQGSAGDPAWSPDGRRIIWASNADICIANADGTRIGRLTYASLGAANIHPAWQPLPLGSPVAGPPAGLPGPSIDWNRNDPWIPACGSQYAKRSLTARATPAHTRVGGVVTYRIQVENRSKSRIGGESLVGFRGPLDGGAELVSLSSSQGKCSSTRHSEPESPRLRIECRIGVLRPGERAVVTLRARAVQPGEMTLTGFFRPRSVIVGEDSSSTLPEVVVRTTVLGCTMRGREGADVLVGSVRADVICGLDGNDRIRPAAGRDAVYAGPGNDVVSSRDGTRDRIVCGSGRDAVTADRVDWVAPDCERVTRP